MLDAGAVVPLVAFLREGEDEGKTYVAGALRNLASSDIGEARVLAADAVGPLVNLLREGTPAGKANAVVALRNLARSDTGQSAVISAGVVEPLVTFLREVAIYAQCAPRCGYLSLCLPLIVSTYHCLTVAHRSL